MRRPYKLIAFGLVALVIIVSAALTSTSWASHSVGFFVVTLFPVLLLGAAFPLAVGGMALIRGDPSSDIGKMDRAFAVGTFLFVGLMICYCIFYLTY